MSRLHYKDSEYLALNPTWVNLPTEVALSTSSNASAQLSTGFYFVKSDVDTFIRQGGSSVAATTASWKLEAGSTIPMAVTIAGTNDYLAGILSSGTGTLQILKVE